MPTTIFKKVFQVNGTKSSNLPNFLYFCPGEFMTGIFSCLGPDGLEHGK